MRALLKGNISIGRMSSNDPAYHNMVTITIEDDNSRTQVMQILLSPEALGFAITGLGGVDIEYSVNAKYAGHKQENKEEWVPDLSNRSGYRMSPEDKAKLLAPFEVDGWFGYADDIGNTHRVRYEDERGGPRAWRVRFYRFIEPDE